MSTEDSQHLLVASVRVGARAVPLYWRAFDDADLKAQMSLYEREFVRVLFDEVLSGVAPRRLILSADRRFADVNLLDVLDEMGVTYVIRTKASYKVRIAGRWQRLDALAWKTDRRRRAWGRVWYIQGDARHVFLVQARARDKNGHWGVWHLLSNRQLSAHRMTKEYALRFTCEEGFRDAKRLLGFADARIADLAAWARMFMLVAVALLLLTNLGCALLEKSASRKMLRRVRSRRRTRSELSLARSVVELLNHEENLWRWFNQGCMLNLEAGL